MLRKFVCLLPFAFILLKASAQAPVISSFSPANGQVGSIVTITGNGFNSTDANNIVFFGAVKGVVTDASTTQVKVMIPAGASCQPLSVLNLGTHLQGWSAQAFIPTFPTKDEVYSSDFQTEVNVPVGKYLLSEQVADIDGDGKPDLIYGNTITSSVSIYLNTATTGNLKGNSLASKIDINIGVVNANHIRIADMNNDGKPDILYVAGNGDTKIILLLNTSSVGAVSFAQSYTIDTQASMTDLVTGDFDGDGKIDFAFIRPNDIVFYRNNTAEPGGGNVTFIQSVTLSGIASPACLNAADMDGDGNPDLVLSEDNSNTVIFLNTSTPGSIGFSAKPLKVVNGGGSSLAVMDFDGDGKNDVVTSTNSGAVLLFHNTSAKANLSFESTVVVASTGYRITMVNASDMDGDGKPDLIFSGSKAVSIMRNTTVAGSFSTSSFSPKIDLPVSAPPYFVQVADMNGDGRPDIIASDETSISLMAYVGDPLRNPPVIKSFTPTAAGSDAVVTLTGNQFTGATSVTFGGVAATRVTVASVNTIAATVPSTGVSGDIVVITPDGKDTLGGFTFIPPPSVTSFSPVNAASGATVTITGTNFNSITAVRFGGRPAASFTVASPTIIKAVVGTGNSGMVSVTAPAGTGAMGGFKYPLPAVSIAGPQSYVAGMAITPLIIANTGGAIPDGLYGKVTTFAGSHSIGAVNAVGTAASFNYPEDIAIDADGDLFVADRGNNMIRKITPDGTVTTVAGSGKSGKEDGAPETASFNGPRSITIDGVGNMYVSDFDNNTIRKITANSGVTTFAVGNFTLDKPRTLTTDLANNLYAGQQIDRTIVKITPAGLQSVFASTTSPGLPSNNSFKPTGIAADANGDIFMADYDSRVVRKIAPDGTVSTFAGSVYGYADGPAANARFMEPTSLSLDQAGNLYLTDDLSNYIRKIAADGTVSTLAGNGQQGYADGLGTASSFLLAFGIRADNFGNLYVADTYNHVIRKIGIAGYAISPALPDGLVLNGNGTITGTPSGAAAAADYTVTAYNGSGSSTCTVNIAVTLPVPPVITSFSPANAGIGAKVTITGTNFTGATAVSFGGLSASDFTVQSATTITATVATGNTGDVAITTPFGTVSLGGFNFTGPKIDSFSPLSAVAGGTITITGSGFDGVTAVNFGGTAAASFVVNSATTITAIVGSGSTGAVSVTTDGGTASLQGFVKVTAPPASISYGNSQIYTVAATIAPLVPVNTGGPVPPVTYGQTTTLAGSGFPGTLDGQGIAATFSEPTAMTVDGAGNLYVTEAQVPSIRKITPGGLVTTFISDNALGSTYSSAYFMLTGIAADASGNLYVSFGFDNVIKKITPLGAVSFVAGSGAAGSVDGKGTAASFNEPRGLAVGPDGNVYVADQNNHMIRKITPDGTVSTLAGNTVYGNKDGTGTAASFYSPTGVATDVFGNVYVADGGNNLIRKITSTGVVTTFAGSGIAGFADGKPGAAEFSGPFGIAVDDFGNVYVTETRNSRLRKITTAGDVSTVAGNSTAYSVDGIGVAAGFNGPVSVVLDNAGNAVVLDQFGAKIRKVSLSGYAITPSLPGGLSFDPLTGIISGTPTGVFPATDFFVTAYTKNGASTAVVNIRVNPFTLPVNNFSVSSNSVTCRGANNGSIIITAKAVNNYTAIITGNAINSTLPFTASTTINNLLPGTYNVCITVAGQSAYQSCYTLVVTEPEDLSVYAVITPDMHNISLTMKGGETYHIQLNGVPTTSTDSVLTLPLAAGTNKLIVTTDKACQGIIERSIDIANRVLPYPDPFTDILNINLGFEKTNAALVQIYTVYGQLAYQKKIINPAGTVQLDLSAMKNAGVYSLQLSTDSGIRAFKIFKK